MKWIKPVWARCGGIAVTCMFLAAVVGIAGLMTCVDLPGAKGIGGAGKPTKCTPCDPRSPQMPQAPQPASCCSGGCRCGDVCNCTVPQPAISLVKDASGTVWVIDPSVCGPAHKRKLTADEFAKEWGVVAPVPTKK